MLRTGPDTNSKRSSSAARDLRQGQGPGPGCRQLDRQGYAIEAFAYLADDGTLGIVDSQSRTGPTGSFREELYGLGEGQGIQADHSLSGDGDGLAAGSDHTEGAGPLEHGGGQRAYASQHVFTVVQDHEMRNLGQVPDDGVNDGPAALGLIDSEGGGDLGGDPVLVRQRCEIDEADVAARRHPGPGHLDGEPGLPAAARSRDGQQPASGQESAGFSQVGLPADEGAKRHRHTSTQSGDASSSGNPWCRHGQVPFS